MSGGPHLHSIAGRLQFIGERSFWPVWITLTVVALISTALLLRRTPCAAVSPAILLNAPLRKGFDRTRATALSIVLLAAFFAGYIAVALAGEDFTAYDNSQFTLYSLRGKDFPAPIWTASGRFFPLGLQEYNLVGRVTRSALGYHAFAMCEMLVLAGILLMVDQSLSFAARGWLVVFALTLPSVVESLLGLIYTEWDVIFWIASMALSIEFFTRTRSVWWALAAVACAQFALYYKEPVFLFLLTFAMARMLLRAKRSGSWRAAFRETEARLDLAIAAVSLGFVAYYAIVILANSGLRYLTDSGVPPLQALEFYLRSDWLIWIFAAFTLVRLVRAARGAVVPELLWDGLACGALAYFFGYLAMGMVSDYYLAPADLIAALYLGRFLCLSWSGMGRPLRAGAAILAAAVIIPSLDLSMLHMVERKFVVQRKAMIADAIVARRTSNPGRVTRLYFPFTTPYGIAEFAAYLTYRGAPVEEVARASPEDAGVELFSARTPQTGQCVAIRTFVCHAGAPADEGLAVVFPDDGVPPSERKVYQELEEKLRAQEPMSPRRALFFRTLQFIWTWTNWM